MKMPSSTQAPVAQRQMAPCPRPALRHWSSKPCVTRAATMVQAPPAVRNMAQYVPKVDAEALHKKLEAKSKALIALEEQEISNRPVVRITFQKQINLGESWKVVGMLPELGRFVPEVAPNMLWSDGHVWTYEGRFRPGVWYFKLVLKRADGAFVWEEGPDRVLEIPDFCGGNDILEMEIDHISFPM